MTGMGAMRMDLNDVDYDAFLANDRTLADPERTRAPIQRLADTVSGYFVPAVIAAAVLALAAWMIWGPPPTIAYALVAAVSVVIIACPCALGLATPMSIMVGVGKGATAGVLIKNAEALERMEKVDTLVVDIPSVAESEGDRRWGGGSARPGKPACAPQRADGLGDRDRGNDRCEQPLGGAGGQAASQRHNRRSRVDPRGAGAAAPATRCEPALTSPRASPRSARSGVLAMNDLRNGFSVICRGSPRCKPGIG
jgi:hypothetical protein